MTGHEPGQVAALHGQSLTGQFHSGAAMWHGAVKVVAVTIYLLGGVLTESFVIRFVLLVLLGATDFWSVKKVTGRLLVGMLWVTTVDAHTGETRWYYHATLAPSHPRAVRIFWMGLAGSFVAWTVFALISLLKFNLTWLVVCLIWLALTGTNIWGFYKCRRDRKRRTREAVAANQNVVERAVDGVTAFATAQATRIATLTATGGVLDIGADDGNAL